MQLGKAWSKQRCLQPTSTAARGGICCRREQNASGMSDASLEPELRRSVTSPSLAPAPFSAADNPAPRVMISVTALTRRSASEKSLRLNVISYQGDACVTYRSFMLRVMSRIEGKE